MDRTTATRLRRYLLPVVTDARVSGEAPVFHVDGADRGTYFLTFSMDDAGALRAAVVDGLEASPWVTSEVGELLSTFVERVYASRLADHVCGGCGYAYPVAEGVVSQDSADHVSFLCASCHALAQSGE